MKTLLFLCTSTFALLAMNRSSTPPILIARPESPGTQIRKGAEKLSSFYTIALSSSPEKIESLLQKHNCPKKAKSALEEEMEKLRIRLNETKNNEKKRQLSQELINLHFALDKICFLMKE